MNVVILPEKRLEEHAEKALAATLKAAKKKIETLKKTVGAPWGKDQKSATLAAVIALQGRAG